MHLMPCAPGNLPTLFVLVLMLGASILVSEVSNMPSISWLAPTNTNKVAAEVITRYPHHLLATFVIGLSGQTKFRRLHIKFQLKCLAEIANQTDTHVMIYTTDPATRDYIDKSDYLLLKPLLIAQEHETNVRLLLETMHTSHPNARSYAFVNGDVCPSIEFIDQVHTFHDATCHHSGEDENKDSSRWRFASVLRSNVRLSKKALRRSPHTELSRVVNATLYEFRGIDFFGWNKEMFLKHVLPSIPNFSMPLYAADHFLMEDAHCNGLVFIPDETIYHVEHKHLPVPAHGFWPNQTIKTYNAGLRDDFNRSSWKRLKGIRYAIQSASHCLWNHENATFSCDNFTCETG